MFTCLPVLVSLYTTLCAAHPFFPLSSFFSSRCSSASRSVLFLFPPTNSGRSSSGNGNETFTSIVWKIRLPRTILIALTGAALGGSGATYQGLFRNPLADPFLIGVASGAGLGAVIAMSIKWPYSFWGLMAIPMAAFIAALLTVFIVYSLARVGQTIPTTNLILAGVAFSSFATSLTSFLMLRSTSEVRRALGWLLGGASQTGWTAILAIIPYLIIGLGILSSADMRSTFCNSAMIRRSNLDSTSRAPKGFC